MKKIFLILFFPISLLLLPYSTFALEEQTEFFNEVQAIEENEVNKETTNNSDNSAKWLHENGEDYYIVNGEKVEGWQTIGNKTYFFGIGTKRLLHGWQSLGQNKKFYLYEDGSVKQGWQHIGLEDYYVKDNYMLEGFNDIEGKTYFFGINSARLLRGWQSLGQNKKFYLYEDGSLKQGWQHIGVEDYYVKDNYMLEGFNDIDGKTYFFGINSARLLHGWQSLGQNKKFYLYEDGSLKQGWQHIGLEDYYVKDNYMLEGFNDIEGKTYFFGINSARLLHGWQSLGQNKRFYLYEDGSVKEGLQEIDGKTYYVKNHYVLTGLQQIDGKTYYFDSLGAKKTGKLKIDNTNNLYIFDDVTGEFKMLQYIPHYYKQKDERWKDVLFLKGSMGGSGCTPTSIAMAFESLLGYTILPIDVANWLYYNTNTFNRTENGANGLAIIEAAKHWNIELKPIKDIETLNSELQAGRMVYAAMTNGKFATSFWNHAIIISQYENGKTYAYDPLNESNNGWIETERIWQEQSKDNDDLLGGAALYSLKK